MLGTATAHFQSEGQVYVQKQWKKTWSWAPVAQAYNPSYKEVRDQEGHGSQPAWANSSVDPISKIPNTKKGWQSGSSGGVPA
jgi:hypothetical protein